nr:MAG TPA: hypothetical protein [Caudoviricetes sp.]
MTAGNRPAIFNISGRPISGRPFCLEAKRYEL